MSLINREALLRGTRRLPVGAEKGHTEVETRARRGNPAKVVATVLIRELLSAYAGENPGPYRRASGFGSHDARDCSIVPELEHYVERSRLTRERRAQVCRETSIRGRRLHAQRTERYRIKRHDTRRIGEECLAFNCDLRVHRGPARLRHGRPYFAERRQLEIDVAVRLSIRERERRARRTELTTDLLDGDVDHFPSEPIGQHTAVDLGRTLHGPGELARFDGNRSDECRRLRSVITRQPDRNSDRRCRFEHQIDFSLGDDLRDESRARCQPPRKRIASLEPERSLAHAKELEFPKLFAGAGCRTRLIVRRRERHMSSRNLSRLVCRQLVVAQRPKDLPAELEDESFEVLFVSQEREWPG